MLNNSTGFRKEIVCSVNPNIKILAVDAKAVRFQRRLPDGRAGVFRSVLRKDMAGRPYFITENRRHYLYRGYLDADGKIYAEQKGA